MKIIGYTLPRISYSASRIHTEDNIVALRLLGRMPGATICNCLSLVNQTNKSASVFSCSLKIKTFLRLSLPSTNSIVWSWNSDQKHC